MKVNRSILSANDEDIVILSDVDEMILNEYFEEIIEIAKQKEIMTIKLHFTLFYFNLYSTNWGGRTGLFVPFICNDW